ncbi:hypothetical protein HA402_012424 [Bradysia odoriphaga]|nr:hypothetical protein HA402_012424 [Bradysia odoriphaga]
MQSLELNATILFFVFIRIKGQSEISSCGQLGPNVNPLMIHATSANHWPWHAAIFHTSSLFSEYKCGGSVISSGFVLTAAHCVSRYDDPMDTNSLLVSLGRFNLGVKNEPSAQTFQVGEILLHPKYRLRSLVNDIALVRLSTQAEFNNYVQPICVWMTNETDLSNVVGKYGMYLFTLALRVIVMPSEITYQIQLTVLEAEIVSPAKEYTSVCFGDSGGSMFFERNGVYFIRGIVSATPTKINKTNKNEECDSMQYALFTDVAQYIAWIGNVTKCEVGPRCISKLENKLVRVTKYENRVAPVKSSILPTDSIREKRQISTGIEPVMTNSDPQTHHWPWHAAIYQLNESVATYRCGGTVISASSILTAGHCVSYYNVPMNTEQVSVSLGRLNLGVNESTAQNFDVAEIIIHPKFSSIDLNNDIAILRLSTHATFTNYVQPICLWQSNKKKLSNVAGRAGMVVGWGLTEMGIRSNVLRQAFLPVEVDSRKCLPTNRGILSRYMWESNYCAGSRNGTSVCFGDSGGSMTFVENGVAYIRGIVSLIPGKQNVTAANITIICDSAHYALFTDVALYLSWIEGAIVESEKNVHCISESVPFSEHEANDIAEDYNDFVLGVHLYREIVKISSCGQRLPDLAPLITNSNPTHHWPWHAAIYHNKDNQSFPVYQCGGTVISSNSVLTAAHCVSRFGEPMQSNQILVSLGRLNLDVHESSGQNFTVTEVIIHPDFKFTDLNNDIAILRLSTHATYNNYVQPICMWPSNKKDLSEIVGRAGMVVGWGQTETGEVSRVLRQASIPVVSFFTCLVSNRGFYGNFLSETNFCAGHRNGLYKNGTGEKPNLKDHHLTFLKFSTESVPVSEYAKYENEVDDGDNTIIHGVGSSNREVHDISSCGQRLPGLTPLMTNSNPTHHWPWHTAIYRNKDNQPFPVYQCGGTVISSNSVLTAAHCVSRFGEPMQSNQIQVSLGRLNLDVHESSGQNFTVAEVIIHPDFEFTDLNNDIAILRLSTHATYNNYVQPICMWPSNKKDLSEIVGRAGMVVGWGQTEKGEMSRTLREASITVVNSRKCLAAYRDFAMHVILETHFCAGLRNGTSTCLGDSGGSMTFEESGVYYIRGILSLAPADNQSMCDSMEYSHFTDVVHYLSWIEEVTAEKPKMNETDAAFSS